jgi:hypothetical protein
MSAASTLLLVGCAHTDTRLTPPSAVASREFRLQAYLATLQIGMTAQDAQRELDRCGCIPFSTVSSVVSHRAYYLCFDGSSITLQYDAHDKLVGWESAKGQKVPLNPLEPTATVP